MPWKFRQHREKQLWHAGLLIRLALVLLVCAVAAAIPYSWMRLKAWDERRRLGRAQDSLNHGDFRAALLEARRVLASNPKNLPAGEIVERATEAMKTPDAMSWRRMQKAMESGDTDELMGLAEAFVRAADYVSADHVLAKVKPGEQNQARFHVLTGKVANTKGDVAAATLHWSEAVRLAPEDIDSRLQLAELQLMSGKPGDEAAALKTIEEIKAQPAGKLPALRTLLGNAKRLGDKARAREIAAEIAADPQAEFSDKLALLDRLRALRPKRDREFSEYLAQLQESAAADPEEIFSLMSWMVDRNMALLVSEWESKLPADVANELPVAPAAAAADVKAAAWQRLRERVEPAAWGDMEFLRLALLSLALEHLGDWANSKRTWDSAVETAQARPELLERLATLARSWSWKERTEEVLWKLAPSEWCPRWAMDYLWSAALARGDTAKLYETSKLLRRAQPDDITGRNNELGLALLSGQGGAATWQLAETLFKENPKHAFAAATHAFALYQQRKAKEAVAILENFPPEELRKPSIAQYYGIFLAATGQAEHAMEYLQLASTTAQLPEEKRLVEFSSALCQTKILDGRGDEAGANAAWSEALHAVEGQPDRLEMLAKTALDWNWPARADTALLKLAAADRCPAWGADRLWAAVLKTGDAAQLYAASRLVSNANPESAAARNNFLLLALLGRHEKAAPFAAVEDFYKKNSALPEVVATYGLALCQQGKADDAVALAAAQDPAQLSEPRAALYHGIFLASAGRGEEAQTQLQTGLSGIRYPEEKALTGLIQTASEAAKLDRNGDASAADAAWNRALAVAQDRPDWLEMLARMALKSGPPRHADAALWKLTKEDNCPHWVIDTLWAGALKNGNSADRYKVSKLLVKADPKSLKARSTSIILALLTGQEADAPQRQAEAFYQANVGDPEAVVAYGLSLYLQDRASDATKLTAALSPEQLRDPHASLYHGIFLASGETPASALEFLRAGARTSILPEERQLLEKVAAVGPLRPVLRERPVP